MKSVLLALLMAAAVHAQLLPPIVAAATAGAPPPTCPSVPGSPAPIAFWSGSGDTSGVSGCTPSSSTTVYDSGGGGTNSGSIIGTLSGGIAGTAYSLATGRTSIPDALTFDGSTNYVSSTVSGFPAGSAAGSNIVWIKPAALPTSGQLATIFGYGVGGGNCRYLALYNTSGAVHLIFGDVSTNNAVSTATISTTGVWMHVGYSYGAGASSVTLDINGTYETIALPNGPLATTAASGWWGYMIPVSLYRFQGDMNDNGMWGVGLSTGQMTAITAAQN